MGSTNKSYVGTEFCGLCQDRFPQETPEGLDIWQSKFRAGALGKSWLVVSYLADAPLVLRLDPNDEYNIEITDVASLPGIHADIDVGLSERLPSETVTICRSQLVNVERPTDGPAFCFHDWCYSILVWKLRRFSKSIIKSVIYKLVRSLLPSSSLWGNICGARHKLDPVGTLQTLAAHADHCPLELQPDFMPRFPAEVRARIWESVGLPTPLSAFIIVEGETSRLIPYIKRRSASDLVLERGCYLSTKMIMLFGTEYIQDLVIDKDHKGTSKVLGDVTGLKLVLSLGGICAFKVVGTDWETDWLGKIPGVGYVWHGMIRDINPRLRFTYNDLNCVNISSLGPRTIDLILWDKPNIPSTLIDPVAGLLDFGRESIGSSRSDLTTYKRRFFRYLHLYNGAEYIKGLTLYQTGNGIVGLETHFSRTSHLSGCRNGCALYFPLWPNERIAYTWLRIVNIRRPAFYGIALTIQTSLGRIYTFGSYIPPSLVMDNLYKWILLKSNGCITGFYYENSSSTIMGLGVTGDDVSIWAPPLTPQYHTRIFPPFPGPNGGTFLSVADLRALKKVDLCRVSNRCIGILIQYANGQSAVLGQWRTQGNTHHSCIYNSDTNSGSNIYFTMIRPGGYKIVTDISFSEDMSKINPDSENHIFELGQEIAWWFSESCDAIVPWTGEVQDILEDSKTSQEQFILPAW